MTRMTIAVAAASATLLALSAGNANAEVSNYSGTGGSRTAACSSAKALAESAVRGRGDRLDRFGSCECNEVRHSDSRFNYWNCSVDAYYTSRD